MDFLSQLMGAFGMGGGFSPQTPAPGAPMAINQDGANMLAGGAPSLIDTKKLQESMKLMNGMFPPAGPGPSLAATAPAVTPAPQTIASPMMQPQLLGSIQAPAYNPLSPLRPPRGLGGVAPKMRGPFG